MQRVKKKKKKLLPIILVLALLVIIVLVIGKKQGMFGANFQLSVTSQTVESKDITELITANGKIQPKTEIKISPDVSGEIIQLNVKEGDDVQKGQLLVIIRPDIYIQALNQTEAGLNSARAMLAQAEARKMESELAYKRQKALYDQDAIAQSDFESAETALKVAEAEVRSAEFSVKSNEASVEQAKEELTKTKIYAPMSGTVSRLNVEQGERVVGTNMYEGTEMMVVANLDQMEVKVEVNENDIVKVSKNDTALVEVDAYLKRKFKGVVTEIANSANTDGTSGDQVTNFDVKVLLLKDSYADLVEDDGLKRFPFRPGMSATVDIQTNTRNDVISVPIQAVTTRTEGEGENAEKQEIVFLMREGRAFKQEVETGIQDNMNIEIVNGLKEGDEIITGPFNAISRSLKDSLEVKKVDEKELFSAKK